MKENKTIRKSSQASFLAEDGNALFPYPHLQTCPLQLIWKESRGYRGFFSHSLGEVQTGQTRKGCLEAGPHPAFYSAMR